MFRAALLMALRELRRNLMRSILTTLGIVIGVAAVIAMVTLGEGATARVTGEIGALGENLIFVVPGAGRQRGPIVSTAEPFAASDVRAVQELPGVAAATAIAGRSVRVVHGTENRATMVQGVDPGFFDVRGWEVARGRRIEEADERAGTAVCVIGETVRVELFGERQDPLGAQLRAGHVPCTVIGVLEARGRSTFGDDQDDLVLMPLSAFQRRIAGSDDVAAIFVSAVTPAAAPSVKERVESLMRQRRGIREGDEDDFAVRDLQEIVQIVRTTTDILTAVLGAIAAISLLVGGIGIMNIMLVSVTERTREIGIRMAIGARARDVLLQFLVEAIVLCLFGSAIGLVLGFGASYAGARALDLPFVPAPEMALVAVVFAIVVGVTFGFVPARKAARLDPIEALRRE
ncbi:MAG: ABC transporter permease [Myxococcota bacterium]|nr:ABC transporter permease [Myxococcota bacterium]